MSARADVFAGVVPFVRTAELRSFGRAAAELGVTTAAVSKAVRRLEDDLGVRLLERSSRQVALTRAGAVFLERCRPALLGVQGARDAVRGAAREPHGELALTLPVILAPFVVPGLGRLRAQYPRLAFRVHLSDRIARLAEESYDVAIRMGALADSDLVARKLRATRWVTVAAPSYLARHGTPRAPAELAAHDCLRFVGPSGKPRDWVFTDGDRAAPRAVHGSLLIDHGAYLLAAAEAGHGVCQVLDFMVTGALATGALVELLAGASAAGPPIHAVTTPARAATASVRAALAYLVDALRA